MLKLNKYLIENFFSSFFTLFTILFIIASMIFLLTISNMTAILKINIFEFLYLYVLTLPEIIFYTLPLSFFITAAFSLSKLFETSELITVLSTGVSPKRILKSFFFISLFFTFLLLIITFLSVPTSNILYKNFINVKKTESQFNFKPSEIGQKFGNWNIFIDKKEKNSYKNVVLYNNKQNTLILAKNAKTHKKDNYFVLSLYDGTIYYTNKKTNIIKFEQLNINNKIKINNLSILKITEYIKTNRKKINKYFLISIFPFISFFFIGAISFFHNRYEKNHSITYALIISITYYISVFVTYKHLYSIILIPIFILVGYIFERKRIARF
jgi:lipopolysaccharide export system permease protein